MINPGYWTHDTLSLLIAAAGFVLLGAYCTITYSVLSRARDEKGIAQSCEPPDGLSPASVRFMYRRGYDTTDYRSLVACLVDMAVRGFITIHEKDGDFAVTRTGIDSSELTDDEQKIAHLLFRAKGLQSLAYSNHRLINRLAAANVRWMETRYMGEYLKMNTGFLTPARLLLIATIVGSIGVLGERNQILCASLLLVFAGIGIGIFLSGNVRGIVQACRQIRSWKLVSAGFWANFWQALFVLTIIGIAAAVMMYYGRIPPFPVLILVAACAIELRFERMLKRPTSVGQDLLDRIEGFRSYLLGDDMNNEVGLPEPLQDIRCFEKYLPYALALEVESEWARRFSNSPSDPSPSFIPNWYSAESLYAQDPKALAALFAGPFADTIALAYVEPYRDR